MTKVITLVGKWVRRDSLIYPQTDGQTDGHPDNDNSTVCMYVRIYVCTLTPEYR